MGEEASRRESNERQIIKRIWALTEPLLPLSPNARFSLSLSLYLHIYLSFSFYVSRLNRRAINYERLRLAMSPLVGSTFSSAPSLVCLQPSFFFLRLWGRCPLRIIDSKVRPVSIGRDDAKRMQRGCKVLL